MTTLEGGADKERDPGGERHEVPGIPTKNGEQAF